MITKLRDNAATIGFYALMGLLGVLVILCTIGLVTSVQRLIEADAERNAALAKTLTTGNPYTEAYAKRLLAAGDDQDAFDAVMRDFYITHVGIPANEYQWRYSDRRRMIEYMSNRELTYSFNKIHFAKHSDYYKETGRT